MACITATPGHGERNVLRLKRVYDPAVSADGMRILVDRLWPRGLNRQKAEIDRWMKEIAPSAELRQWFGHEPARWAEFQRRYKQELRAQSELVNELANLAARGRVTLVFGARDETRNDAVVLAAVVRARMKRASTTMRATRRRNRNDEGNGV
jgi:uncharacterized protein YeaO (DUF488 family)